MTDFTLRSDSVNVEQIMRQVRARIDEKRGVDYTEDEIRRLATVKLEAFLDPKKVRSDLVEHFRRQPGAQHAPRASPPPNYSFEERMIYESSRSVVGRLIYWIRRLLRPILKLFFNPRPIVHVLHMQSEINAHYERTAHSLDVLTFEVLNNLVVEMTRLGIDMKNYKMRLESVSSRLDFDERRARALESIVEYRPGEVAPAPEATAQSATENGGEEKASANGAAKRRRRRRRGRRRSSGGTSADSVNSSPHSREDSGSVEPEAAPPAPDEGGDTDTSKQ